MHLESPYQVATQWDVLIMRYGHTYLETHDVITIFGILVERHILLHRTEMQLNRMCSSYIRYVLHILQLMTSFSHVHFR